jgi:hypothetical protein
MRDPKELITTVHKMAKKNLESDGHLRAMAFLDAPGGLVICDINEMMRDEKSKDQISYALKKAATSKAAKAILFMSESWVLKGDQKVVDEYMNNRHKYPNGIADHPNRAEMVMFNYEGADGRRESAVAAILRGTDDKPYLTDLKFSDEPMKGHGRFVNFFEGDK